MLKKFFIYNLKSISIYYFLILTGQTGKGSGEAEPEDFGTK
jgi:hypothetical protein